MAKGRCPQCGGKGRTARAATGDSQSPFPQLCPRCQGSGSATLDRSEADSEFGRKSAEDFYRSQARGSATQSGRSFKSGIDELSDIRQRRDAIRHDEGRSAPPLEPKPDPRDGDSYACCASGLGARGGQWL